VPKTANASPSGVASHEFILLSHYVQSIASPAAAWQLRYSFIYLLLMNVEQTLENQTVGFKSCRSRRKLPLG
jgi:hypothetical protein